MRSLAGALFGRKGGVWNGPLGSLISDWIRESDQETGGVVSEDRAMRIATVAACVRLIAQNVASLPLHMYRLNDDGTRELAGAGNSLEQLLQRPNAWQTTLSFREQMTAALLLRGNAYAWISWTSELAADEASGRRALYPRALELVPIHPDRVELERTEWRSGPRYFIRPNQGGTRTEIPADEMFHLVGLSFDGTRGRGVIEDAREAVGVALGTQAYARRFWANDATPGVVITTEQALTNEQAEDLADRFDERHAGQARRTAVLGKGAKIDRLAPTAEDSQFLETRKYQATEIAGLFNVPPHMVGLVDRSTSWGSGIEQQQIGFVVHTLRPWLKRWEQAIRHALINVEGRYQVEHDVSPLLRGDLRSQASAFATGINWGWWSPNDVRRKLNENPRDGGDVYLQPANMVAAGSNPAEDSLQADAANQARAGERDD